MRSKQLKLMTAGVGASAAFAMVALGVTFSNISAAEPPAPAPPGPVTTSEMTTAPTVTEEAEVEGPETSIVVPPMTTTPSENPPTAVQH